VIEAIIFDFGGVFTPSPFGAVAAGGETAGYDTAHFVEIVFGPYDQDTDHPWHRLERGEVSFRDAHQEIRRRARAAGIEADPFELLARGTTAEPPRDAMIERARSLRAEGYRTALLTNNVREFGDAWRAMIPVDDLFELVVDSSHEGIRKPDPAIFHRTLERLGVNAASSVFLDDYPGNIEAARALGMQAILVTEVWTEAIAQLDALLDRP
jgi:epoxide hydrolase-like predicted phosphatase